MLDFSNLNNIREIAYADPVPIDATTFTLGGDWSSHYYNGLVYQSDITRGLLSWVVLSPALIGSRALGRLNPQTQEFTTR